jgi:hypothetical protein
MGGRLSSAAPLASDKSLGLPDLSRITVETPTRDRAASRIAPGLAVVGRVGSVASGNRAHSNGVEEHVTMSILPMKSPQHRGGQDDRGALRAAIKSARKAEQAIEDRKGAISRARQLVEAAS